MELLFSLILELVSTLRGLGLVVSVYFFFVAFNAVIRILQVLGLSVKLLTWIFGPRAPGANQGENGSPSRGGKSRALFLIATAALAVFLAAVFVANRWYFEPITRWSLSHLEKRAGIEIDFAEAEGSLWSGEFNFRRLTARRATHHQSCFNLSADSVSLDISMWHILWRMIVFDSVSIKGVRGEWEQVTRSDKLTSQRFFRLNQFSVDDMTMRYVNRTVEPQPFAISLRLDTLRCPHMRSDWFLYDLFFHSNLAGSVDGTHFRIMTSGKPGQQYETLWTCDSLPIPVVAQLVGTPLDWFEKGSIDIRVENRFRQRTTGQSGGVLMHWSVVFRDFHARAPEGSSLRLRAMAKPLLHFVNRKSERLDLSFEYNVDRDKVRHASSADLSDLFRAALGEKALEALGKLAWGGESGGHEEGQK